MLRECPHCLIEVLPMANGACPSCQNDLSDDKPPPFTKLTVHRHDRLPNLCCTCGEETMRAETVQAKGPGLGPAERTLLSIALFIVAWPFLFLLYAAFPERQSFEILMPRCAKCRAANGDLVPDHVNLQAHTMLFVVARAFAKAVKGEPSNTDTEQGPYRTRSRS
jgi:hypothetical protein